MTLTRDEKVLIMLYGDGTRSGLEQALNGVREELEPDETELWTMTGGLLKKLRDLSEEAFQRLIQDNDGGMDGE